MKTALVPYRASFPSLPDAHAAFHAEHFGQKRSAVLQELRCMSGLPEVVRSLNPDILYKLVVPEGTLLQQGKDGLFRGVFYKDGGIDKHAKFAQVSPSLLDAAKVVSSQVLLISIAMQLNRIEQMVNNLSIELHRDRIAEIYSGVDQFDKAMLFTEITSRNQAIGNAVQTLHTGLYKTIAELKSRIASAPDPENSIWYHLVPWNNKTEQAKEAMALAAESFGATLLGIRTLAECYSVLGEIEATRSTLLDYFEKVEQCKVETAAEKARLVEFSGSQPPQEPWVAFHQSLPEVRRQLGELTGLKEAKPVDTQVEIEFMPHELYGAKDGNLP